VQERPYTVAANIGPTDWLPAVGLEPDQPPVAVQAVAPVVLQESVTFPPDGMDDGVASRLIAGGGADTVTIDERESVPPIPEQESSYVAV
jgi:hypothetical protein